MNTELDKFIKEVEGDYKETKFALGGGSCFECCDYEGMDTELTSFIKQTALKAHSLGYNAGLISHDDAVAEGVKIGYSRGALEERARIVGEIEKKKEIFLQANSGTTDSAIYSKGVLACANDIINIIKS